MARGIREGLAASCQRVDRLLPLPAHSREAHKEGSEIVALGQRDDLAVEGLELAVGTQGQEHLERAEHDEGHLRRQLGAARAQAEEARKPSLPREASLIVAGADTLRATPRPGP